MTVHIYKTIPVTINQCHTKIFVIGLKYVIYTAKVSRLQQKHPQNEQGQEVYIMQKYAHQPYHPKLPLRSTLTHYNYITCLNIHI